VEDGGHLALDQSDLGGIGDDVEDISAGQGHVDLVRAALRPWCPIAIAAKTDTVGEALEEAHSAATLRTENEGPLALTARSSGHELAATLGILTPVALPLGVRILAETPHVARATRTTNVDRFVSHTSSFRARVCKKRAYYERPSPCFERSLPIHNVTLMR
jgi:hypothetical protein